MALIAEAAELLEHFQWATEAQSCDLDEAKRQQVKLEIADVFIYLLLIAERADVDLIIAATDKIDRNGTKYPADKVRGSAKKYTEY